MTTRQESGSPADDRVRIAFIGAGKMASALAAGVRSRADVVAFDVKPDAREAFARATGAAVVDSLDEAVAGADAIVLAVKPAIVPRVLDDLAALDTEACLISIAAGVTLQTMQSALPAARIIRVMPNTPAMVGQGAAAMARGELAGHGDAKLCRALLESVGLVEEVPEPLLDAVTGLSGSGPAYGFVIIEALADAGVRMGLPRAMAITLAAQTMRGAAAMVLETGEHPGVLKDSVTSPGGTTIAGLAQLEAGGLRSALIEAVTAATEKSRELGRPVEPVAVSSPRRPPEPPATSPTVPA